MSSRFKRSLSNFASEKKYKLPKFDDIDKFTSTILKSKNWMEKNLPLNGNAHLTGKVGIGS